MIWSPNIETLESGNIAVTNFPATQPVSGTVSVDNFPATQAVSATDLDIRDLNSATDSVAAIGPLTDTELRASPVPVTEGSAASATVTRVATNGATAVTLVAANASRLKFIISTETGTTYVKLGATATSTDYSVRLTQNSSWELTGYSGIVTAIRSTGSGDVQVTEL